MNEQRVIQVLARIEDEREGYQTNRHDHIGFAMETWLAREPCGTTACLAGHAVIAEHGLDALAGHILGERPDPDEPQSISGMADRVLGLTYDDHRRIHEIYSTGLYYLADLDQVYRALAHLMGVEEQVLRDKVQGVR